MERTAERQRGGKRRRRCSPTIFPFEAASTLRLVTWTRAEGLLLSQCHPHAELGKPNLIARSRRGTRWAKGRTIATEMTPTETIEVGAAPPRLQPWVQARPGRVDVWRFQISAWSMALCRAGNLLDAEERARARRCPREVDRTRFLITHILLRRLLGSYVGIPPRDVTLSRAPCPNCGGPHGRPQALDTGIRMHFSMSRTEDMALIAVAAVPVGIDVETLLPSLVVHDLVEALHPAERLAIDSMPPDSRAKAALTCWVRKEAHLKGCGTGLCVDPASVHVGCGAAKPVAEPLAADGPDGWSLIDLPAGTGHIAAVALASVPDAPVMLTCSP